MEHPSSTKPLTAGIERPNRYRLSGFLIQVLQSLDIDATAWELVHCLAHAICRQTPDWHNGTAVQPNEGYTVRCLDLRTQMGRVAERGNRSIARAIDQLRQTQMFDRIEFRHGNQWLSWRLANAYFSALFDPLPNAYGLFDIEKCRHLKSRTGHILYAQVGLVRQAQRPQFMLDLPACATVLQSRHPRWSAIRKPILDAARTAAKNFDVDILLLCDSTGHWAGIDRLIVRLFGGTTTWKHKALTQVPPGVRKALILHEGKWTEMIPKDVCKVIV